MMSWAGHGVTANLSILHFHHARFLILYLQGTGGASLKWRHSLPRWRISIILRGGGAVFMEKIIYIPSASSPPPLWHPPHWSDHSSSPLSQIVIFKSRCWFHLACSNSWALFQTPEKFFFEVSLLRSGLGITPGWGSSELRMALLSSGRFNSLKITRVLLCEGSNLKNIETEIKMMTKWNMLPPENEKLKRNSCKSYLKLYSH